MKRAVVVLLVLCGMLVNAAFGQKPTVVLDNDPGWHKIGQITANFKMDTESIIVYGRDEFTKLKLKVTDAPILIERVQLFYEEGDMEEIAVGTELQTGGTTSALDLKGTNKELEKVVFTYKTLPNYQGDKATVELYGLKTRQDRSDAFRDDDGDDKEVSEEVNEAGREIDEETREAREEVKEESREARQEAREAEKNIEEGAEKTGDDISEAAGNAASHVKDKVYVDKVGPDGQTIYIDKHSRYYYISNEGKKVFVSRSQLKDKPDNK
jgi:vacuolar-type H+-ATPase subunit H